MKHDRGYFTTAGKLADINMMFHSPVFEASDDLSLGDLESNQQYNYKRIKTTCMRNWIRLTVTELYCGLKITS